MPKVGSKRYSYSPSGVIAAKRAAARTGKPMVKVSLPKNKNKSAKKKG